MASLDTNDKLTDINTTVDETISPYFSDVFSPWETKEQLEIWLEVKNPGLWTKTFTTVSSFWLWNTKITCWFKPKVIQIMTIINNQASWNYVSLTDISWYTMFYYTTSGWYFIVSTTNIIDIFDNLWNSTLGTIVSIDDDWFTVNLSRNFVVTQSMITCIW